MNPTAPPTVQTDEGLSVTGEAKVPKRLVRDTRHGMVAGVAAGFGQYLDVDPVLVRLAFVLLVFANGLGLLAYLVCWLVVPRAEAAAGTGAGKAAEAGVEAVREAGARFASEVRSAAENVRSAAPDTGRVQAVVGSILIVGGALLLADNLGWLRWPYWANVQTLWPLVLVALGVGLIAKSRRSVTA
jgi:phage shock protein C